MCKIALFAGAAFVLMSAPTFGQNQFNPNGNPVLSATSGPAQPSAAQNAANQNAANQNSGNSGATSPQSNLTPEQIKQQIQLEMARMAKDMIASFDQNGDKALNEKELQEALVALTTMMRGNNQQQGSANNTTNNGANNSASNRTGTNNNGTSNLNANNVGPNTDPTNTGAASQRIRRRR